MTISNLPTELQKMVQAGWIMRLLDDALYPTLRFRGLFEGMEVPQHLGQTYTFSKKGLLPVVRSPLTPATTGSITSGLTPQVFNTEQYSVEINQYAQATATNLLSSGVMSVSLVEQNVRALGFNAGQSLDQNSRATLFQAYAGGRTYLTAAATASTTITVKDISGFDFLYVNGVKVSSSVSNPHAVTVDESGTPASRNVTGFTAGSLVPGSDKIPGTLTLNAAVTSVIGDSVISSYAPASLRPNSRTTSYDIVAGDLFDANLLNQASATLMSLGVQPFDNGYYKAILDPFQLQRVYDTALNTGLRLTPDDPEFMRGAVGIMNGVMLYQSNQTPNETNEGGVLVHRGIVVGKEPGYEVRSSLIADWLDRSRGINAHGYVEFSPNNYVAMIMRNPIDTLQQEVTDSWSFIGNWVAATDVYGGVGNSTANYRRGLMLESA